MSQVHLVRRKSESGGICRPLKVFLVEVALACAVNVHELRLTELGTWKLPKMRYKGASILPQKLHLQRKEPVSSLKSSPHRLAVTDGGTSLTTPSTLVLGGCS